ncbi:MAG: UDP-N-acetylmuramoyl-L-alanine--D-glutamate ligase [bacterium]|nr:UDP-N-acetylmuramoyl-L-alanine--D-glutamate ligase [bacterium]
MSGSVFTIVLGGGISGLSAALAERRRGREVIVVDERRMPEKRRTPLIAASVVVWEDVSDSLILAAKLKLARIDLIKQKPKVVASPGIPKSHWFYSFFQQSEVSVVSEVDNAFNELGQPLVGVTGTNGKTTTVNLIHQLLFNAGFPSALCGNVGYAPSELCATDNDVSKASLVVELSSYQLETSRLAVPKVAVLLNLAPDHLERHKSLEGYLAAKARIVAVGDRRAKFSVVPAADKLFHGVDFSGSLGHGYFGSLTEMNMLSAPLHVAFDEAESRLHCAYCSVQDLPSDDECESNAFVTPREALIDIAGFKLYGRHNLQNLAAAVMAALFCGASPASIEATIPLLEPVEHRLEPVGILDGVFFVNDSKATNLDALFAGYEAITTRFRPEAVTVLVGGRAKKEDWKVFAERVAGRINSSIVFGESADMIVESLHKTSQARYYRVGCLEEAVAKAWGCTPSGGVILLSPGCASFDAYESFEERGSHFRKIFAHLEQDDSRATCRCLGDSISAS